MKHAFPSMNHCEDLNYSLRNTFFKTEKSYWNIKPLKTNPETSLPHSNIYLLGDNKNASKINTLYYYSCGWLLVNKLRMAVKKGLITLVTHVERRLWHKSLELLLARHTFSNSEGALQVTIGKVAVDYNPSFRLYLSSSLPLFVPGEGHYPLPFSKTSTIDATISREGVCDMLWVDTLRLEHPEFEGQQRSIVRDISLHKQQIDHAKVLYCKKMMCFLAALHGLGCVSHF